MRGDTGQLSVGRRRWCRNSVV